jgi:cytochrome P450
VERIMTQIISTRTPSGSYTLESADVTHDPYPLYHAIRGCSPVYFDPRLERWLVTGYDAVTSLLSDQRFSSKAAAQLMRPGQYADSPVGRYMARSIIRSDPPAHTRLRSLVNRAFTPHVVEPLRPRIQSLADNLLDKVQGSGRMCVRADLAFPLPIAVITALIGADLSMAEPFRSWTADLNTLLTTPTPTPQAVEAANRSVVERDAYIASLAAQRRERPANDLITGLATADENGDRLSVEDICAVCGVLMSAGHETTTNLICNGLLALLRHPDQLTMLREHPELMGTAVEEFLRYDSPVQWNGRLALDDVEVAGVPIQRGDIVSIGHGPANRDPRQFPDPDVLDIKRNPNRHLAFGHGIHFCVGAALARLEAPIAIHTVLHRMPNLRLAATDVAWNPGFLLRSVKALPVVF